MEIVIYKELLLLVPAIFTNCLSASLSKSTELTCEQRLQKQCIRFGNSLLELIQQTIKIYRYNIRGMNRMKIIWIFAPA
ncbi:hypothetical protein D3C73_1323390 [compost metagenome]